MAAAMKLWRYLTAVMVVSSLVLVFMLRDVLFTRTAAVQQVSSVQHDNNAIRQLIGDNTSGMPMQTSIHQNHPDLNITKESHSGDPASQTVVPVLGARTRFHDYIPSVSVGSGAAPRIPHIIHQTWDDENVPVMFSAYIRSWPQHHPTWEYWFWTPTEVSRLLEVHYPKYAAMYADYAEPIFKANLMRYFIMHRYGGVYADLDLESLRPMDNWTMDNECVLSQNHFVHAFIASQRNVSEVMITLLASRPAHPYFALAIDMLPSYRAMPYDEKLVYAETVYRAYLASGAASRLPENRVTVVHPDYFLPTFDRGWAGKVSKVCSTHYRYLSARQEETCAEINNRDGTLGRRPKSFSYANHYWEHVIMWGKGKVTKQKIQIRSLVPNVIFPLQ